MDKALEAVEVYEDNPYRKVFTSNELCIPGLTLLGWHYSRTATPPIVNHFHRDCIEITLVVQGNLTFSAKGKQYILNGSNIFITPANLPHDSASSPVGICELYWFQLRLGERFFLFLSEDWAADIQRSLASLETGMLRSTNFSRKNLAYMFSLISSASTDKKYQGISLLVNILYEIIKLKSEIQDTPTVNAYKDIQKAVDFIHANISEELELQDLADLAGLSLPRFKQKFNEQIGMPPRMFINAKKVEKAQEIFKRIARGEEEDSITNIAFDLGFNSSSYFSSVFRKLTMLSPYEFIKKNNATAQ